jgi:hypothetical protein
MQHYPDIKARAFVDLCNAVTNYSFTGAAHRCLKNQDVLGSASVAFIYSARRLANMAVLPIALMDWSSRLQAATDGALFNLTGTLFPKESELPAMDVFHAERNKVFTDNRRKRVTIVPGVETLISYPDEAQANADDLSCLLSEDFAYGSRAGMRALCASLVVGAYTALECLAVDVWKAAVNSRPRTLAKYALESSVGRKAKEEGQQEAAIPYGILADNDFNISNVMGDVLVRRRRVSFDSFYDIREAYLAAFRIPQDPKLRPSQELSQIFSKSERDLRTVEEVRNLIVHQGGVIDQKFIDNVSKTNIPRNSVGLGHQLDIDCESSAQYALSAFSFAKSLVIFVDEWLDQNPSSPSQSGPGSVE